MLGNTRAAWLVMVVVDCGWAEMKSRRRRSEWRSGEGRYGPSADVTMPGVKRGEDEGIETKGAKMDRR